MGFEYLLQTLLFAFVIAVLCAVIGIAIRDAAPRKKTNGGKR